MISCRTLGTDSTLANRLWTGNVYVRFVRAFGGRIGWKRYVCQRVKAKTAKMRIKVAVGLRGPSFAAWGYNAVPLGKSPSHLSVCAGPVRRGVRSTGCSGHRVRAASLRSGSGRRLVERSTMRVTTQRRDATQRETYR